MVRAILDGRKSQTRRAVKPQPRGEPEVWLINASGEFCARTAGNEWLPVRCPYGVPGDLLWVREEFSGWWCYDKTPPSCWNRDGRIWYWADGEPSDGDWTLPKPSIHMPRWASRITLRVTEIRVERLQEISEEDAIAEGAPRGGFDEDGRFYENPVGPDRGSHRCGFAALWEHINGPSSWDANPWVWVVGFERTNPADRGTSGRPGKADRPDTAEDRTAHDEP
jgi:hypothetical protein